MNQTAFLISYFLFSASFAFSQSFPKYELSLTKRASAAHEEITYSLLRNEGGALLNTKEKMFPSEASSLDSLYLTTIIEKPSDERKILLQKFFDSKAKFSSDSLVIPDQKVLVEIDQLVSLWDLLEKQAEVKNESRFVLDGYWFIFSLSQENQKPREFTIHSPDGETHPEIRRLLKLIESLSQE